MTVYQWSRRTLLLGVTIGLSMMLAKGALANSVYLEADSYEVFTDVGDIALDYRLTGFAVGGELIIGKSAFLQLGIGQWSDDIAIQDSGDSDITSESRTLGAGYTLGHWQLFVSYSEIQEAIDITHGVNREYFSEVDIESTLLHVDMSYQWKVGMWAHRLLLGAQRGNNDVEANLDDPTRNSVVDIDTEYVNIQWSTDYHFYISDETGIYVGASMDWYDKLSSDSDELNVGGLTTADGHGGGRTSGDDGGILGLYLAFDMDQHWSVDINTAFGVAGDAEENAYSVILRYRM